MDMNIENGKLQVYTGNGKGKTTAAFGLAVRAAGHGFAVKIIQFMKSAKMFDTYGEIMSLKRFPEIEVAQFGTDNWVDPKSPAPEDVEAAKKALARAREIIGARSADVLILDEILYALKFNLIGREDIDSLLDMDRSGMEVVMTGRDAPEFVMERADLVTEMREIKHYFRSRKALKGVEF